MQTANTHILLSKGKFISLSQGNILNRKQLFVCCFGMSVCCLFIVLTLVLLVIPQIKWDILLTVLIGICDVGSLAFLSVLVFVLVKNKLLINKITPWLDDAVKLKAYSKKIGENRLGIQSKGTKIQVRFTLDGLAYRKDSSVKVFGGQKGYVGWFNKYADKELNILYSPRYDEILIFKD